jgi:hypothetical protein
MLMHISHWTWNKGYQIYSYVCVIYTFMKVICYSNALFRKTASLFNNRVSSLLRSQINLLFGLRCSKFLQLSWMYISNVALSVSYRSIVAKFRISAHRLRIETGRYERIRNSQGNLDMLDRGERICLVFYKRSSLLNTTCQCILICIMIYILHRQILIGCLVHFQAYANN